MTKHKNSGPGIMKFRTFVNSSVFLITTHLVCLNHAPKKKRRNSKKYINFTLFTKRLSSFSVGVMKFTISCFLTGQMLQNLVPRGQKIYNYF